MTLRAWNSFEFDSDGWTLNNTSRTAATGQSGYASLHSTPGTDADSYIGITAATEVIVGFCFKHTAADTGEFFNLWSGGYNGGFLHFSLSWVAGGAISALSDNGANTLGTSVTGILAANTEAYIEVRVLASTGVGGEVEVRVNGNPTPVLNLTGKDTGAAAFDTIGLTGKPSGTRDFSAFYYVEVDATPPNDFLGHIRFGVLDPNGNGNSNQWNGSDGNSTNNYLLVDDGTGGSITNDSDTTYVEAVTVGNKDTYAHENMPTASASIIAVCPRFTAKKTDAGSRSMVHTIRSDGVDYDGAEEHFLGTSYGHFKEAFLEDPDTSAAWTDAGVNAAEFGYKVES